MIKLLLSGGLMMSTGCAGLSVVRPMKDGVRARVTAHQRGRKARCLVLAAGKARARAAARAQRAFARRYPGVTAKLNVRVIRRRKGVKNCAVTAVATARKNVFE